MELITQNVVIETEVESDGRWIADAVDYPGIMAYGRTKVEAIRRVLELLRKKP